MRRLHFEFAMMDLGPLYYFLGISMKRFANSIFLSQEKYAAEVQERAGMQNCKPIATPVDTKAKLSSNRGPPVPNPTLYRSLTGALQYLTFTRTRNHIRCPTSVPLYARSTPIPLCSS